MSRYRLFDQIIQSRAECVSVCIPAESLEEGGEMGVVGQDHSCYYKYSEVMLDWMSVYSVCVSILSGFADSLYL